MKITFICAVFPPEPAPCGVMAHQLATQLVRDAHDVTMIVPIPNRPEGITYPGFQRRLFSRTMTHEGYTLVRCANWLIGKKRRSIDRILENLTFGFSSAWAAWREGRPDVIVVESWPLFATQIAAGLARWWRVPYLYYVQDVYPETVEVAGFLNSRGLLARTCRAWDRHLCLQSSRVIVISETMRRLLVSNRRLSKDRFTVIHNFIDESLFPVCQKDTTWRRSHGIADTAFVAMFAGTLGHISGAEVLVEVANLLQGEKNILLLCIGEGVLKQDMIDKSSLLQLDNIRFLPFQPSEIVPLVQASSDVALLTMRANHSDASVPSKLISYLASFRPVVCAANPESAVAQTVQDAAAGIVVCPGDARAIADAILWLSREPETASQMGQNARRYFEAHYTLKQAYGQFSDLIRQGADSRTSPLS
jgi:colanic acid biosynthesis glycosyl transferase WcaI